MAGTYPDYYPNLPGAVVQLNDGVKNLQSNRLSGKNVLLVGQAKDGPVLEKVDVTSYKNAERIFGKYYKESTGAFNNNHLMRNYKRVLQEGADNISLMRIGGETAKAEIPLKTITQEVSKKSRETATAYGNVETTIELDMPKEESELMFDGVQYDNARVENVVVTAEDSVLSADKFYVNNESGEVVLEPNITKTEANIEIEYDIKLVKKVDIEVVNSVSSEPLTNTGDDETFQFSNKFVDENSVVLTDDTDTDITSEINTDDSDFEIGEVVLNGAYPGGVTADYDYFDYETPAKTADNQYQLLNGDIIENSESVYVKLSDNSSMELRNDQYEINKTTGLLSIMPEVSFSEVTAVDYEYRETETDENKYQEDVAKGTDQYIWLNNYADPAKPVVIKVNNDELIDDAFDINFKGEDTTIIKIKSGFVDNGDQIVVNYYYNELRTVKPVVNGESPYGGTIYNDTKITIQDELSLRTNYYYKIEDHTSDPKAMTNVSGDVYVFPDNHRSIESGSVELVDYDSSAGDEIDTLEEGTDYELYADAGQVEITATLSGDKVMVKEYAFRDSEESYVTKVRGQYDPDTNSYTGTFLNIRNPRTAVFKHDNIVPNETELKLISGGTEKQLTEGDHYTIDYSSGIVTFDDSKYPTMFPLSVTDKVFAEKYEYYNVAGKKLTIVKPEEKLLTRTESPMEFQIGSEISTIGELVDAVNTHRLNNVLVLSVDFEFHNNSALDIETPDKKVMSDGTINNKRLTLNFGNDGLKLTKDELYERLEGERDNEGKLVKPGAYDLLMNEEDVDVVVPVGVYADDELLDSDKNFAKQLAHFCAKSFYRNNEVYGLIGTKPIKNPSMVNVMNSVESRREVNTDFFLEDRNGNLVLDEDGNRVDVGKFIGIVAYDKVYGDENFAIPSIESAVAEYASVSSMLDENNSPTNEVVSQGQLAYRYSLSQASALSDNKMITAKYKRGQARIVSALTCAQEGSGWTRHFTRDIMYDAIETARDIFDRYIGGGNKLDQRNSLDSDLRDALKKKTTILDFDFDIIMNPEDQQMGRVIIELDITPVGELQKIHTVVSINANID